MSHPDYERIPEVLDAIHEDELLSLLKDMLRLPSFSRSRAEADLAVFLEDYLREMGLDVRRQVVEDDRSNVIAVMKGRGGGRSLIFNGHMDVNPPAEGWSKDPFGGEIEDGYIYGIGAVNMKAGDAAFMIAAGAVKRMGVDLRGDVILSLVVGELQGGIGTIRMLEEGVTADAFIVAEPTDLHLLIRHMGMVHVKFTVIGRSCHISSKEKGLNAIEYMYRVLEEIEGRSEGPAGRLYERMNIGSIQGGLTQDFQTWRPSLVADYCQATCDFRIPPGQTEARLITGLERLALEIQARTPGLEIKAELVRPPLYYHMPPYETDEREPIVQTVMAGHHHITGTPAKLADFPPYTYYASDAAHLSNRAGIPGVVYGPGGTTVSQPDERVRVADIMTAARVYAHSILNFCS